MVCVGRDLKDDLVPIPLPWAETPTWPCTLAGRGGVPFSWTVTHVLRNAQYQGRKNDDGPAFNDKMVVFRVLWDLQKWKACLSMSRNKATHRYHGHVLCH